MTDIDTKVEDLADRGANPAEGTSDYCILEIDKEQHKAIIVWTEMLAFHAELARSDEEKFSPTVHHHKWSTLTDENGFLTVAAQDSLEAELTKLLKQKANLVVADQVVWTTDNGYDEPSVTWEIVTDYLPDETYEDWLDRIGWPVVATLINATDPGTFMFPYLFSAILYHP